MPPEICLSHVQGSIAFHSEEEKRVGLLERHREVHPLNQGEPVGLSNDVRKNMDKAVTRHKRISA